MWSSEFKNQWGALCTDYSKIQVQGTPQAVTDTQQLNHKF